MYFDRPFEAAGATQAILIVLDGSRGPGFAMTVEPRLLDEVPDLLEDLAHNIRNDHPRPQGRS
jgi:hypothetical protein